MPPEPSPLPLERVEAAAQRLQQVTTPVTLSVAEAQELGTNLLAVLEAVRAWQDLINRLLLAHLDQAGTPPPDLL
jgi:hypothetical protein